MKIDDKISNEDHRKIEENWFCENLNYKYGVCISIKRTDEYKVEIYENGQVYEQEVNEEKYIEIPLNNCNYKNLKNNPPANKDLEKRISELYSVFGRSSVL